MAILSEILGFSTEKLSRLDVPPKRLVLMLRWTLFSTLIGFAFARQIELVDTLYVNLALGIFLACNVAVTLLPESALRASPFEFSLGLLDTAIVSYLVFQADVTGILCLFFFIMLVGIAASTRMMQVVLGSVALSLIYLVLCSFRADGPEILSAGHLMVLPLFFATAVYFGFQVLQIRRRRDEVQGIYRERQELKYVLGILESITSSLDFHTVMFQIAGRIAEVVDAIRCSILLVEGEEFERAFVVAANDDQKIKMLPVDLAKYPEVVAAIRQKKPIIIEDVEKSDLLRPVVVDLLKLNFHSLMVLPILYQETVLGTLFLRASRKRSFTQDEMKFCRVVAHAAASAIKNSMLYQKLGEHARELEQTSDRIRVLFDHSPDLIFLVGSDGVVREGNRIVERLSGMARSEILHEPVSRILQGLPALESLHRRAVESKGPIHAPGRLITRSGFRDLSVTVAPLAEPPGSLILIGRDVTEQNQATALLQQKEKLSSIGEIVAGVAHELNNPLSGVLGFSQLLAQKDENGRFQRDIERIVDCAGRCQKIVQNLLSFARPGSPERKPVGLNGILEKTLDLLEPSLRADNIEIVKEITPDLPYVLADFHQVQQVLTNLINNAQQAMGTERGRGRLTLRTQLRRDGRVALAVSDNGPGIPAEVLPRIFDPFFSTKKQGRGTGLGLSVSFGIVRDHGGEILVETQVGAGTTFLVVFDPYVAEPKASERPHPASPQVPGGREILVVDDEEMIVELYLQLLQALGHSIDTASTGVEALRKIESRNYDLVITDIKMPRMSGIQLYEKVVEIKPDMKRRFIFITGDMNSLTSQQFSTVTDNPCLLKPVNIEKIEATIREVLGSDAPAGEIPFSRN
ncbi:MAG TPA: ATP-binding protein [Candidatus Polarisedimenticolia bacterium]|nr:ATP-binding protein [Candidatus Polarisedimenticolia bacterium]